MWKRTLFSAIAVVLGMSGTTVLAGMLNSADPTPVETIELGQVLPGTVRSQTSLPTGPALPVNPAPVTLGTADHSPGNPATTIADDDSTSDDRAEVVEAEDESGDDDVSDDQDGSGEADDRDGGG